MIIDKHENNVVFTPKDSSVQIVVQNIEQVYDRYKNNHLIVNLSKIIKISLEDIIQFLSLSNTHRSKKKSFVLVSDKAYIGVIPDEIIVVPTLQEAYDVIEMEDIERDLGF